MVRESITRHTGAAQARVSGAGLDASCGAHASHLRLPLLPSGDDDGACLIEPAVRCNHCGYCLSYGH
jgi:hypothetical protein